VENVALETRTPGPNTCYRIDQMAVGVGSVKVKCCRAAANVRVFTLLQGVVDGISGVIDRGDVPIGISGGSTAGVTPAASKMYSTGIRF